MALGQWIEPPSFDLNAKLLDSLDVEERPPSRTKLANAQHRAQLLATFFFMNPLEVNLADAMKLQAIMEKLNKIYVVNLKWQHQQTIDSFLKSI